MQHDGNIAALWKHFCPSASYNIVILTTKEEQHFFTIGNS